MRGTTAAKAIVSAMILVAALACGGSDAILVHVGGSTDTLTITVINQNSVVVSNLSLQVGDSAVLDATAINALGLNLGNVNPMWSSTNSVVATVSPTGVVQGLAAGSANILAVYAGVTATVPTTVTSSASPPPPPPPPPPPGSWPNHEPTGMAHILSTNGSDKYFGGTPTSPGWFYGGRWNDNTYVQSGIPDAGSRFGTVVQKRMFVGDVAGWNGLAEYNWSSTVGVKRHLYVRAIFKYSSNYQFCGNNEKMFYVGGPGGDGADVYIGVIGSNGSTYLANEFNGGGFNNIFFNYTIPKGQYITVEEYYVAESAPGSSDGEYHIWIDGVQRASATGQNWSSGAPGFSQIDLMVYWGGASCTKSVNDVISISEIYVSGK
ncbi:MAG: Ig-like domain-containing protein [Longimicrobiales bacterium]